MIFAPNYRSQASSTASQTAYDPDVKPVSGLHSGDEFPGNISASWLWANQATSTDAYTQGGAKLTYVGATGRVSRMLVAPDAVDFTATAKFFFNIPAGSDFAGMILVSDGTLATPTKVYEHGVYLSAPGTWKVLSQTLANYSDWQSADFSSVEYRNFATPLYMQLRYTASSKAMARTFSFDGRLWTVGDTATLATHPKWVGRTSATAGSDFITAFFRIRTGVNRDLAGEAFV